LLPEIFAAPQAKWFFCCDPSFFNADANYIADFIILPRGVDDRLQFGKFVAKKGQQADCKSKKTALQEKTCRNSFFCDER